ncbi:accessory gene regulator B family protein [Clostridium sp. Marseille-Q2269]|uniref:accessory gene regulator ArgB-like protein n=1 Tax=Clostridium sp. Marseille-Q2269 TaxID=2942205 RepID=UPI002073B42C|nr:accessory gene regulator B family protein [Clostridium sp. Marseille-Q2269]
MFLIEHASNIIASKITNSLNSDKETEEIISYGAFVLFQIIWSFLCVVILGEIFNVLIESIVIVVTIAIYRKYSGGLHAHSPNKCAIWGAIICVGSGIVVKNININLNITFICIFIFTFMYARYCVYEFAPRDTKHKPINNIGERLRLKKYSFIVIDTLFVIGILLILLYLKYRYDILIYYNKCIIIAVLWQSFTLTPVAKKIFGKYAME